MNLRLAQKSKYIRKETFASNFNLILKFEE